MTGGAASVGSRGAGPKKRVSAFAHQMPGLMLTARQAQRLWQLDSPTCATALVTLLQRGFLKQTADGTYVHQGSE
jgi:hypothetical protein